MSELIVGQNAGSPPAPSIGKVAVGYNNVTGQWESTLPGGVVAPLGGQEFGKQYHSVQKTAKESTPLFSFQIYQTLVATGLVVGKVYKVNWSWLWTQDDLAAPAEFRMQLDGNTLGDRFSTTPGSVADVNDGSYMASFIATLGSHTLTAEYAAGAGTLEMNRSFLEIFNTGLTAIGTG